MDEKILFFIFIFYWRSLYISRNFWVKTFFCRTQCTSVQFGEFFELKTVFRRSHYIFWNFGRKTDLDNICSIWAALRFGQNQNLASPKSFDLLQLWMHRKNPSTMNFWKTVWPGKKHEMLHAGNYYARIFLLLMM